MTAWSNEAWERLAAAVERRAGLAIGRDVERAEVVFDLAAREAGLSKHGLATRALKDPDALDALVDALTVGETYLFRDPGQFEFLRQEAIPDVLARRGETHPLRIWSAGCASGEEAWSLAMVLARAGLDNAQVHATDVSRPALEKARRALYGPWSFRGSGETLAQPWLERDGNEWRVPANLRGRVEFARHNLAWDPLPSPARGLWGFDVIFCRNVLLYFSEETVERVFRGLHACLAVGGWLFLGASDPSPAGFEPVVRNEGIFHRRTDAPAAEWASPAFAATPVVNPQARLEPGKRPRSAAKQTRAPVGRRSRRPAAPAPAATSAPEDPLQEVRHLANRDERAAERLCATLRTRMPDSIEVAWMHAILLLAQGRVDDAVGAARQVLYLDRSLAAGHFLLGAALLRRADVGAARRAFATSAALAGALAPDDAVPFADGETAGRFRHAATSQLELLDATEDR